MQKHHFLSLSKLKLFKEIKKVVLFKMDRNIITPERADEIFVFVKKSIMPLENRDEMRNYPETLLAEFPELHPVVIKLDFEEREHIDKVLALFVESIFEKGDFDLAEVIFEEIQRFHEGKGKDVEDIRKIQPEVFDKIAEKFGEGE
jgi:hypothetical protein